MNDRFPMSGRCAALSARERLRNSSCEQFSLLDLSRISVVGFPPCRLAVGRWPLQREDLSALLCALRGDAKLIVVEQPKRFHDVGRDYPVVSEHEKVLAVADVGRLREI